MILHNHCLAVDVGYIYDLLATDQQISFLFSAVPRQSLDNDRPIEYSFKL